MDDENLVGSDGGDDGALGTGDVDGDSADAVGGVGVGDDDGGSARGGDSARDAGGGREDVEGGEPVVDNGGGSAAVAADGVDAGGVDGGLAGNDSIGVGNRRRSSRSGRPAVGLSGQRSGAIRETQRASDDSSSRRRSRRFGLGSDDAPETGTRFATARRSPRGNSVGGSSTGADGPHEEPGVEETESCRREAAIERMRGAVVIRNKNEFGRTGITWATNATTVYGKCGVGALWSDEEGVDAAIWEKYGGEWSKSVCLKR